MKWKGEIGRQGKKGMESSDGMYRSRVRAALVLGVLSTTSEDVMVESGNGVLNVL
jgi:hypothetical protein